jgi:formaldehyde-activating enzyme
MQQTPQDDIDGRIAQGWGGRAPNGVHVNVILARRASPTAAAMITAFASPSPGFCPIGVPVGPDQPSYETVNPPIIMLNKAPVEGFVETLVFGAATVGTAQGVLDCVADGLLEADQETVVFVALWIDPAADDETRIKHAAREAVGAATREAVVGRDPAAARSLVDRRDELTHPFYGGGC